MFPFEIKREVDTGETDELNDPIYKWETVHTPLGWLDLLTGSDEQQYQNSLLATSSHIFLTEDTSFTIESTDRIYNPRTGVTYEITFVELSDHLEIYCKRWA
jgi:hypothetical protein